MNSQSEEGESERPIESSLGAARSEASVLLSVTDESSTHAERNEDDTLRRAVRETVAILSRIAALKPSRVEGRQNAGLPRDGRNLIKQRIHAALFTVGSADRRLLAALAKTSVSTATRALRELQREGLVAASGTTRDRVFSSLKQ